VKGCKVGGRKRRERRNKEERRGGVRPPIEREQGGSGRAVPYITSPKRLLLNTHIT